MLLLFSKRIKKLKGREEYENFKEHQRAFEIINRFPSHLPSFLRNFGMVMIHFAILKISRNFDFRN